MLFNRNRSVSGTDNCNIWRVVRRTCLDTLICKMMSDSSQAGAPLFEQSRTLNTRAHTHTHRHTHTDTRIPSTGFWAEPVLDSFCIRAASHEQELPVISSIWKKRQKGTKCHMTAVNIIPWIESQPKIGLERSGWIGISLHGLVITKQRPKLLLQMLWNNNDRLGLWLIKTFVTNLSTILNLELTFLLNLKCVIILFKWERDLSFSFQF